MSKGTRWGRKRGGIVSEATGRENGNLACAHAPLADAFAPADTWTLPRADVKTESGGRQTARKIAGWQTCNSRWDDAWHDAKISASGRQGRQMPLCRWVPHAWCWRRLRFAGPTP